MSTPPGIRDARSRELAARYDQLAGNYAELLAPILRAASQPLLARLADPGATRVFDVGVGVGSLTADLRRAFPRARLFGGDPSSGMLRWVPAGVAVAQMDARQLALVGGSVDVALMTFMLAFLEEPAAGLVEARRILRAGGRVGSVTWARDLEAPAMEVWNELNEERGVPPCESACASQDELLDTPEKMEALCREAGFASSAAWTEGLEFAFTPERLTRLLSRMGPEGRRFGALGPEEQRGFLAAVAERFAGLEPEAFLVRLLVVPCIAVR